jgi:polysaccharide deacetylase family protein (PEP-CTERM system associated)
LLSRWHRFELKPKPSFHYFSEDGSMYASSSSVPDRSSPSALLPLPRKAAHQIILTFDIEEHFRIEEAAGMTIDPELKCCYGRRMETASRWLLNELGKREIKATFFILGQIAQKHPQLVRAIHAAGHEVASHGWDHQRVHNLSPAHFRNDVRWSKDALEQITGDAVVGYRAPTFSIVRETAWAVDELVELGIRYDSSIYPVWHDRYGVPDAPRFPFFCVGTSHKVLELPLTTLRFLGVNFPVGGGGYFRLLPSFLMELALRQVWENGDPGAATAPVSVLYFHPWEFDSRQPRLPLRRLSQLRTYVGIDHTRGRFKTLLAKHKFARAVDVVSQLQHRLEFLPTFRLTGDLAPVSTLQPVPALAAEATFRVS